jgi:hypothetical protein
MKVFVWTLEVDDQNQRVSNDGASPSLADLGRSKLLESWSRQVAILAPKRITYLRNKVQSSNCWKQPIMGKK